MTGKETRWLIVGLQNPGRTYAHTRHNLGGRVVETFRKALGLPPFRAHGDLPARVIKSNFITLAIPATLMNESGQTVAALVKRFSTPPDRLLLVHDDKDLAFGQIRLQSGRGPAGHRGVQSVMDAIGNREFWRLRIGIGNPPPGVDTDTYVLTPFSPDEEEALGANVIPSACTALRAHLGI